VCGGVAWVLVFVSSPFRWWGPWLCVGGSCLCAVKWIVEKKKKVVIFRGTSLVWVL
jgi:hypothetical protein